MSDKAQVFIQHAGVFSIGAPIPGAPHLEVVLTIPNNSSNVSGHGFLTQAINPPLHANNAFSGGVHVVGTPKAEQIYALQGSAVPPLFGAPHVIQLFIVLDGVWGTKGTATYTYVFNNTYHEIKDAPVTVKWLLQ